VLVASSPCFLLTGHLVAGDEFDAAEIDKELLASRLRQDTVRLTLFRVVF
jgi:predicted kinase